MPLGSALGDTGKVAPLLANDASGSVAEAIGAGAGVGVMPVVAPTGFTPILLNKSGGGPVMGAGFAFIAAAPCGPSVFGGGLAGGT